MNFRDLEMNELLRLFEERKKALIEVRDEIDRRQKDYCKKAVDVDFTKYVEN